MRDYCVTKTSVLAGLGITSAVAATREQACLQALHIQLIGRSFESHSASMVAIVAENETAATKQQQCLNLPLRAMTHKKTGFLGTLRNETTMLSFRRLYEAG